MFLTHRNITDFPFPFFCAHRRIDPARRGQASLSNIEEHYHGINLDPICSEIELAVQHELTSTHRKAVFNHSGAPLNTMLSYGYSNFF